jgi:hypothetical protein
MALTREVIEFYQVDLPSIRSIQEQTDQLTMYVGIGVIDIEAVTAIDGLYYPTRKASLSATERVDWESKPAKASDGTLPSGCVVLGDKVVYTQSLMVLSIFEDDKGRYLYSDGVAPDNEQEGRWYIPGTLKAARMTEVPVFRFHVNPARIEVVKNKHNTKIRTRKGFEFQYWGQEITAINITGTTGSLLRAATGKGAVSNDEIYDSPAYQAFKGLEDLYNNDHKDESTSADVLVGMRYRNRVFIGHFDTFTFTEDAEKPYSFSYTIKFSVQDEVTSVASTELSRRYAADQETLKMLYTQAYK